MAVTARELNRATLQRQMLLEREPLDVVEAVRRIVAIQAQEPPSPYVALWNRVAGFDPADLDRAFTAGTIVKAPLMRITLHAVAADEYPLFHEAVTPTLRAARLNDERFRITGLAPEDADALVPGLLAFAGEARYKDDIHDHLAEVLGGEPHEGLWWALRTCAPLVHAPMETPWSFGRRPWFKAPPVDGERPPHADALRHLIVRYLKGFGPATIADFAQFTLTKKSVANSAFGALRDELVVLDGPDGRELFDAPGAPATPAEDVPTPPRLMAMWDSTLFAYADRTRMIPEEYRSHVIRRNGDSLPTILVDGHVAGVWRPTDAHVGAGIEVTAFHTLDDATWDGLAREAAGLLTFLADREPTVYRRYGRWWDDLPSGDRRVLP